MNKRIFAYIFLALMLAFSVSAIGSIDINETGVSLTGNPGSINSSMYVTVMNTGSSALSVVTNSSGLTGTGGTIPSSAMMFVPSPATVSAGSNVPVALVLTIPPGQKAGTYTGTIESIHNSTNKDSAALTLTVLSAPGYSETATTASIVQGLTGQLSINVTNTGNADISGLSYSVSPNFVSGSNTLAVSGSTTGSLNIAYGASSAIAVPFTVSSSQATGTYTGQVNLSYGGINHTLSLSATVTPIIRQMTGTASSAGVAIKRSSSSIQTITAGTLALTNTGNYPLSGVTITVSSLAGPSTLPGSTISLSENGFAMATGSSKTVYLTPTGVSASLASGTYAGSLLVSYGGTSNLTVPFSMAVTDASASIQMDAIVYAEAERETNVSKTITITNNGAFPISGISMSTTAPNTWFAGTVPSSLAVGGSFSLTATSTVPKTASGGVSKIGTLSFVSNEINKTVDISVNAKQMLKFESVKISIDDGSWTSVDENESYSDDIKPGSKFALKVKLENLFSDDGLDIEDVEVNALFRNAGESGDDIEGNSESFDIDAGDNSAEIEIDFDDHVIDWEADEGSLEMELTADGEDEDGGRHRAYFNFSVVIERENSAEFIFTKFDAPGSVSCGRTFTITADGRSIGQDSDDEVVLRITNTNLGIDIDRTFEMGAFDGEECDALDGDDEDCNEFSLRQDVSVPSSMASGTYTITAKLYRDNGNKQTDDGSVDVTITCGGSGSSGGTTSSGSSTSGTTSTSGTSTSGSSTTSTSTGSKTGSTTTPTTTGATPSGTTSSVQVYYGGSSAPSMTRGVTALAPTKIIDTTKSGTFSDSEAYLALLSILSVLAVIGIILLLVYGLTSKKQ